MTITFFTFYTSERWIKCEKRNRRVFLITPKFIYIFYDENLLKNSIRKIRHLWLFFKKWWMDIILSAFHQIDINEICRSKCLTLSVWFEVGYGSTLPTLGFYTLTLCFLKIGRKKGKLAEGKFFFCPIIKCYSNDYFFSRDLFLGAFVIV